MEDPKMTTTENAQDAPANAAEAAQRVQHAASDTVEQGKQTAQRALDRGKEEAKNAASYTADALRRAADEAPDEHAWLGGALRKSASAIEGATQSLASGDLNAAMDSLNNFARRQPALFLGASLALGFALARVGKTAIESAATQTQDSAMQRDMQTDADRTAQTGAWSS